MLCNNCKQEIDDAARFCMHCGTRVEEKEAEDEALSDDDIFIDDIDIQESIPDTNHDKLTSDDPKEKLPGNNMEELPFDEDVLDIFARAEQNTTTPFGDDIISEELDPEVTDNKSPVSDSSSDHKLNDEPNNELSLEDEIDSPVISSSTKKEKNGFHFSKRKSVFDEAEDITEITDDIDNSKKMKGKKEKRSRKQRQSTQAANEKLLHDANTDGFYDIPIPTDADEVVAGGIHLAFKVLAIIIVMVIFYLVLLYFI